MAGGISFPLQYGGLSYRFRYMWGIGRPLKHTDSGAIRGKKFRDCTDSVGIGGNWMPRNTKYHHGFPGSGVARGP